ncbi:MAG: type II toxin-antitoxin system RelE/ParE family toxin [bacterium]|uniref:Type II toxin-antitoxin system RelE/ParE family toxin n=1 Tax=Candidatus Methylomirabilis tolerans TaxID=3123416 RepID=A0AAJ1AJA2_9BACT|nr:type II toxin-antitoxin system RelE/ParE family toxin [Candidatus Methylomirabilis sp.]
MSRRFSIHETAEAEINEAADFYDLEDPGLGSVFIDEVERGVESISQFPEAAQFVRRRVRKKPLVRFPYSLVYSVRPDEVRLLAVAHQKRRPFYWRGRR